ncbi:ferredoxin reductase [Pseudonocardia alaniniphila]|uniref:Ferredoxin reductase n=1 Tax=Pseudonocardia alaniniphila TaxID=75291 RepID=A0ABS9TAM7_9PSEU|nr:ferredoxin reductase [Pseudonocardia alaniniphila]MCH6165573.1 ferredoxin reductase [Pseudonocardia alaniniphila]
MTLTPGGTTHRRTLRWQTARVLSVRDETPRARTFRLALPEPRPHLAGQHYVVRLTAPDGYTASRSYSVASAPDGTGEIELTVERLEGGEVSEFLHDVVRPGDELEVRGPIGLFFVWEGERPALLVGGGSGVVPLMAMLRQARAIGRGDLLRLVVSARSPGDLYYADELPGPESVVLYTWQAPPGAGRTAGRIAVADIAPLVRGDEDVYVCGSPAFADAATDVIIGAGIPAERIRVERFGPSG